MKMRMLAVLVATSLGGYFAVAEASGSAKDPVEVSVVQTDADAAETTCAGAAEFDAAAEEGLASFDKNATPVLSCASWVPSGCCGSTKRYRRRCWVGGDSWYEYKCQGRCYR